MSTKFDEEGSMILDRETYEAIRAGAREKLRLADALEAMNYHVTPGDRSMAVYQAIQALRDDAMADRQHLGTMKKAWK